MKRTSELAAVLLLLVFTTAMAESSHVAAEAAQRGVALWKSRDTNRYPEVAADFRQALANDPQNPNYHSLLGRILLDMGDVSGASAELTWTMGFRPYDKTTIATTHLAQGQCLELLRHPDKAAGEYQKVIASRPGRDLADEASMRSLLCRWHHDSQSHCVLVSEGGRPAQAAACEAAVTHACTTAGVELAHPVLVYILRSEADARKLQVSAGDVVEGRQQVYVLSSGGGDWAPLVARIVAARMGTEHSLDPVVRHGVFQWLTAAAASPTADKVVPLSQLRSQTAWGPEATAEAAAFVEYLARTYGLEAFHTFWSRPEADQAAMEAFHKGLPDLEAEWLKSLSAAKS